MKTITLNDDQLNSLNKIITYLMDSEENHYLECLDEHEEPDTETLDDEGYLDFEVPDGKVDHIYLHTKRVKRAISINP